MKRRIGTTRTATTSENRQAPRGKIVRMEVAPWDRMTQVGAGLGASGSALSSSGGDFGFRGETERRRVRRAS